MKKQRIITGAIYFTVLVGLIVLKWLVPVYGAFGFDVLFCAVSVIGCVELMNAVQVVPYAQRAVTTSFCALTVPLFVLSTMLGMSGYLPVAVLFVVYAAVLAVFWLCKFNGSSLKSTLLCLFAMAYCGLLCGVLSAVNHLPDNSLAAILLMFFTIMFTDCGAYFIGSALRRWIPHKLAPKISPNKTVIGGIGGLVGGMGGAVVAYYLHFGLTKVTGQPLLYSGSLPVIVAVLLIGLATAIVAQAGDLFESFIKRKCNIKDSGKILPGHGGILDRFDSMLFGGVLVLVSFLLLVI